MGSEIDYRDIVNPGTKPILAQEPYYDLGEYSWGVTTTSPETQKWFDRGLMWSYGFCHDEAVRCFEQAILHDPKCSSAYWGFAYARGPNYNKPWELFDKADLEDALRRCHLAAKKAVETAARPIERELGEALIKRFPAQNDGEFVAWQTAYASAMTDVYASHGDDLDVATLTADAWMNTAAWDLWDIHTGEPNRKARTLETKAIIEKGLAAVGGMHHPGLIHLYIHLMEMSPTPEIALNAADNLRGLVPDSGHLNHMPSHLDLLIGDWRRAIASNFQAVVANEKYMTRTSATDYYTFYRLHDYHIIVYAAMFNGQYNTAIDTAHRMKASLPENLLRIESPPLADWLESSNTVDIHVLVRFGKWQEILDKEVPTDPLFCVTIAVLRYARGIAYSVMGDIAKAEEERTAFREALAAVPDTRLEFPNKATDILKVGEAMLDGELEYRKGNFETAFEHLRTAINRSDHLVYAEPWGWMQPPRHAYAALKLEQGDYEEARRTYAADLGYDHTLPRAHQHPNNVWSLHGYHECLIKLGRTKEAEFIMPQLRLALAVSHVEVKASCYCRRVEGDVEVKEIAPKQVNGCCAS